MKILIKIYKKAGKYKLHMLIAALATLVATAAQLVTPKLTQEMVKILEPGENDPLKTLSIITAALLAVYIIRAVATFLWSYIGHIAAWRFVSEIRAEIYAHLQKLSAGFYKSRKTGELMSRVINDTADFEILIAHAVPEFVSGTLM
ncbi:MAG: ABC transporter ATP-binding protein, partial [Oscillospiraceae bacterium]|nr:ABC transporter ATP-binding protein [Oscillospiraceae bacterium]